MTTAILVVKYERSSSVPRRLDQEEVRLSPNIYIYIYIDIGQGGLYLDVDRHGRQLQNLQNNCQPDNLSKTELILLLMLTHIIIHP